MSDWSSFPNDKKLTDSWRQYLCEGSGRDIDRFVGYKRSRKGDVDKEEEKPEPPKTTALAPIPKTTALASRASDCGAVAQGLEKDPIAWILCAFQGLCDVQKLEPKEREQQLIDLKKKLQMDRTPDMMKDIAVQINKRRETDPKPCPTAPGQIPGKPAPGQIPGKPAPGQLPGRDQLQITGPTKPTVDPTKRPETRVVYYLDDSYRADRLKGSWDSVNQRKGGFRFKDDLAAFLNFFGPFVPKHVTEKGLTEDVYSAIEKVADSDYLRGRMDKILPAFQKLLRSEPKEAAKVNRMARIFQKETGRKEFGRFMLKIRKKTINLKAHPETPPSGETPATVRRNEPVAGPKQPPSEIYEERLKRQDKTLFENWQRVAGINPRVL